MSTRVWAARGEHWADSEPERIARQQSRDLYAPAECGACRELFANLFVLWRHRPQDVPPDRQRCLSERQLYRLGMYRVAGQHKGQGVWHDTGRVSPIGNFGVRGDERPLSQTETLPKSDTEPGAVLDSCADKNGGELPTSGPLDMTEVEPSGEEGSADP
jgi:hypothetical protein